MWSKAGTGAQQIQVPFSRFPGPQSEECHSPVTKTTSRQLLTLAQGMDPEVRTNSSQGTHRPHPDNSNRLSLPLSVGQSF